MHFWLCCSLGTLLSVSLTVKEDFKVNTISFLWLECELLVYSLMRYEIKMLASLCKGCICTLDLNEGVMWLALFTLLGVRVMEWLDIIL